jgi:hypothetical protein
MVSLNVLDLWTSAIALGRGLVEGNGVVVALAGALGLRTVAGLLLTKSAGIAGGLAAALIGIRYNNRQVKDLAMGVMLFLTVFLLAVSINNLYMIGL